MKNVSVLASLLRTGLLAALQPQSLRSIGNTHSKYNTGYYITPQFKEFIDCFPNWEDIALSD